MGYNFSIAGVAGRLSRETFIDEGDLDVERVFEILHKNGYEGLVISDHAPQMDRRRSTPAHSWAG